MLLAGRQEGIQPVKSQSTLTDENSVAVAVTG